jgi:hypothetical protein
MVLTTKHRMILYRKFRRDIWGYSYTDTRRQVFLPKNPKFKYFQKKKHTYKFDIPQRNNFISRPSIFDNIENQRTLRLNKLNIHLLKSPYLKFFFGLWWRKRKTWRRKRRRYVYKFDRPPAFRKWRKYNKRFLSIRLTRLYFLTFQDHQFRKLFRSAAKMDGILKQIICAF